MTHLTLRCPRDTLRPVGASLQKMDIGAAALGDYTPACGPEALERVAAAASAVRGMRVLHLSVAGGEGAVPGMLGALLPLAAAAGMQVEWRVLYGDPDLQAVSTGLRTGLQGAESAISDDAWRGYLDACSEVGVALDGGAGYDAVVLHDPGALGLAEALEPRRTVWRCHLDISRPEVPAWDRAAPLVQACETVAFPDRSFAPERPVGERAREIAPGIDPLAARNVELSPQRAGSVLRRLGLELDRPLCSQLMRLDRWKDPHTALEAFALVREELPDLQLVIACELEAGGEGWPAVKEISDYAAGQEGVHLLTSYAGNLGPQELGALNQLSRLAVRLSLREGFGLASSEALWRGTPVVGGREGGIPLQVRDGIEGYLVEGATQAAERIAELVGDPGLALEMGRAGRERVRERFLITRALEDELLLLASLG